MGWRLALAVLALATWPAHAVEAQYAASARVELRLRSVQAGGTSTAIAGLDTELAPAILGALRWGRTSLSLSYSPSILFRDLQGVVDAQNPATMVVLHRANLAFSTAARRATFTFSEDAAYGSLDITSLRAPDGALPGALPEYTNLGVVPYLRSSTTLGVNGEPGRHWGYAASLNYTLSGNPSSLDSSYALQQALDGRPTVDPRVAYLPFQYGPQAMVMVRARVDASHQLVTQVFASQAHFDHLVEGPRKDLPVAIAENYLVQATESWEGKLSHLISASFGAGAAFSRERIAPWQVGSIAGDYRELLPVVQGAIVGRLPISGQLLTLNAAARLAPYANRFTAVVYERVEARAGLTWLPTRDLTATATLTGSLGVGLGSNAQPGEKTASAEVSAEWRFARWLALAGSGRLLYNETRFGPSFELTPGIQWSLAVSVLVRQVDSAAW